MSSSLKKVLLVYNPISGKGQSGVAALLLKELLEASRFDVTLGLTNREEGVAGRKARLESHDVIVVIGGDGSVQMYLQAAAELGKPIYNFPAGNECLFARYFKMDRNPHTLLKALEVGRIEGHSLAEADKTLFFTMASIGLDSYVVRTLCRARKGGSSRLSYVLPTIKELLKYRSPRLTVKVNGETVVAAGKGAVVVANSPEYACRINPVPEADPKGELLRGRFYPDDGIKHYLSCFGAMIAEKPFDVAEASKLEGKIITIESEQDEVPYQLDGDYGGVLPVRLSVASAKLPVLMPI